MVSIEHIEQDYEGKDTFVPCCQAPHSILGFHFVSLLMHEVNEQRGKSVEHDAIQGNLDGPRTAVNHQECLEVVSLDIGVGREEANRNERELSA
jgi:hypothetical protein